jgi:DNA recombination protein RmuC
MLEDILAQSGFKRGLNYERQETLDGGGRPDYTFKLPPNRVLFLDSKFPLDNYIAYFEASDDTARRGYRDAFIKNVEARVKELEDRDYQSKEASALDYVLLFIPNESVLAFIQQEKPSLIDEAVRRRVVLCSPLTLYAFLSVVRQATDSFYMEQRANEVFGLLSAFGRAWADYDRYLKRAATRVDNLQETIKSLTTGRIRSTLQKQLDRIDEFATSRGIDASGEIVAELHAAIAESNIEEIDE